MNIIFDLDGTLWDSSKTIFIAWKKLFSKYNISLELEEIQSLMGLTINDIKEYFIISKNISEPMADKILKESENFEMNEINKNGGVLYNDVENTLKELSKNNKLYIVSNCESWYIESFLNYFDLSKYFKDTECAGNTKKDKKYNIELLIKRNNLKNCIYVGDTIKDMEASFYNKIKFVYASYGFGNVDEYTYKLNKFSDLIELCKNISK